MIYVTHDQTEAMTMADEIVVLENGKIAQVGAPLDLYNNPKNQFVAGFIGSPKMNFLACQVLDSNKKETTVEILGSTCITVRNREQVKLNGSQMHLGIRPEHLSLTPSSFPKWTGKVIVVEKLGSLTFLYLEKAGEPLIVEIKGDSNVKTGELIDVYFDAQKSHLFDGN